MKRGWERFIYFAGCSLAFWLLFCWFLVKKRGAGSPMSSGGAGKCWCVVCSVWCVRFVMLASCWCAETGDPSAGTELAAVHTGNDTGASHWRISLALVKERIWLLQRWHSLALHHHLAHWPSSLAHLNVGGVVWRVSAPGAPAEVIMAVLGDCP